MSFENKSLKKAVENVGTAILSFFASAMLVVAYVYGYLEFKNDLLTHLNVITITSFAITCFFSVKLAIIYFKEYKNR
jgi:hypothetical protein